MMCNLIIIVINIMILITGMDHMFDDVYFISPLYIGCCRIRVILSNWNINFNILVVL